MAILKSLLTANSYHKHSIFKSLQYVEPKSFIVAIQCWLHLSASVKVFIHYCIHSLIFYQIQTKLFLKEYHGKDHR